LNSSFVCQSFYILASSYTSLAQFCL
jgi:hypothetical protein